MFSAIFVRRPRLALVISIIITLAGIIAQQALPVEQFPDIVPPQVRVSGTFAGANAEVVETTVAQPIESEVNGVDNMIYMKSTSGNDGTYNLNVSFEVGTNPDLNTVNTQNRVSIATPKLPEEVQRTGVKVEKQSTSMLQVYVLYSPNGTYDTLFMNNYVTINILDSIKRINGVGDARLFGLQDYSMRIWYFTDRLTALNMTPQDVVAAIQSQNVQAAVGRIGARPISDDVDQQFNLSTKGRLEQVGEFENIIIRANPDGSVVRVGDVARVELGARTADTFTRLNGAESSGFAIYQSPGSNALATAAGAEALMDELAASFPEDLEYKIVYDTTVFVKQSIDEVYTTLLEALALVIAVVFLFLGNWRSTLIPACAVPVSLIGTFAVMAAFGVSLNTVSLLALVLAIGVVVDDAIVVVEGVERIMAEEGLPPAEATIKAMEQLTAPIIATTLVLLAVFVPVGFIPGIVGKLFQQFAIVISFAVVISSLNALTLSPALCSLVLKPGQKPGLIMRGVKRGIDGLCNGYAFVVDRTVRLAVLSLVLIGVFAAGTGYLFQTTPTGFLPDEDQGVFLGEVLLPEASSVTRTEAIIAEVEAIVEQDPTIEDVFTVVGYSILDGLSKSNAGVIIGRLKPFAEREGADMSVQAALARMQQQLLTIPGATAVVFNVPAISGLGNSGGFEYQLLDRSGRTTDEMAGVLGGLIINANERPEIGLAYTTWSTNTPQVFLDVERDKARALGVEVNDIFTTLQATLGSLYVNDFNRFGRTWQVNIQGEAADRDSLDDIGRIHVRNASGEMVPLSGLVSSVLVVGPQAIIRYNNLRSATLNGAAAPGFSSGQALATMEEVSAETLPEGWGFAWTGTAFQEKLAAGQTTQILILAVVFGYLFLVGLYESWSMPVAVLLSVVVAVAGSMVAILVTGLANDVYAQIGLVLLVGLAAKNAILIVEFAMQQRADGLGILDAAKRAGRLRIRAVYMTAFSFLLGLLPLITATGAGAATRRAVGTGVFGGMLAASTIAIFLIPMLYVCLQWVRERVKGQPRIAAVSAGDD
ncbi:MAG: multidrug efflux RND transporter permease subunit [Pseudomonadota bacterium]